MTDEDNMVKSSKFSVQIELSERQAEMFDELKNDCELETRKELFNLAMTLLHWAVKETKNGRKIASYDPLHDNVETISFSTMQEK